VQPVTNPTTSAAPATPGDLPPLRFHRRRRFLRIFWWFLRAIARIFILDVLFSRWWVTRWYARRTSIGRWGQLARGFRSLALQMGGVLIKLGQFLSSRTDILPVQITDELAGLQDEVPPAPLPYILATILAELGAPPDAIFSAFAPTPVAAVARARRCGPTTATPNGMRRSRRASASACRWA
jgi:predicted unusual protein kinase regulating ubiquinone biosynthesis (AarF/ABC1/UbiB family)